MYNYASSSVGIHWSFLKWGHASVLVHYFGYLALPMGTEIFWFKVNSEHGEPSSWSCRREGKYGAATLEKCT